MSPPFGSPSLKALALVSEVFASGVLESTFLGSLFLLSAMTIS
jgi:hypothetical protein